jgi:general secretion pathway protein D
VEHAEAYTFAFLDAEISQVAEEILGKALGLTYTLDPSITGKMSFRIDRKLTRSQLLEAFEAALAANEVVMVRQGDTLALLPRSKAKGAAGLRTSGERHARAGYELVAVPLSYAMPSEVAKALEAVGTGGVVVYQNDKQGLLMLGGDQRELEAASQLIHVFDRNGLDGSKIRWFPLEKAPATVVAGDLDKVLQTSGASGVAVVPLKRLNGLFVFARTPEALDRVGEWVAKLDQAQNDQGTQLFVYRPRNVSAESLGQTLSSVLSGRSSSTTATTATGAAPTAGAVSAAPQPAATLQADSFSTTDDDPVRVGIDKQSNALLISASPSRWLQIQRILGEIDRPPVQVLIEATVLEVTLGDDFRFGVDWSLLGANGRLKVTSSGSTSGAVAPAFPGLGVTFLDNDISVAIDALRSKTAVEVVSAPKIMALDNHVAHLLVGDQVPVVTQSAQSSTAPGAPLVTTTDYRSTGVILNVTPRVTGDDRVTIEVSQEVSSVAKTTTSGIDSPTIQQRKFDSSLLLKDGGTVALGGLISSNRSRGRSGVPFLQNAPVVGALFRQESKSLDRTEMIVLLTVRILRDDTSSEKVTKDLIADMHEIEDRGLFKTIRP